MIQIFKNKISNCSFQFNFDKLKLWITIIFRVTCSWLLTFIATINDKICLQNCLGTPKRTLKNFKKIIKKYVVGTTSIVMSVTSSTISVHNSMASDLACTGR